MLGYTFYSTALGVLGALASRMEEASNASSPVTIRRDRARYFFALLVALNDPTGRPRRIATFMPPVSPMVVPLRAALGAIEPWEVVAVGDHTRDDLGAVRRSAGGSTPARCSRPAAGCKLRDAWRAARR